MTNSAKSVEKAPEATFTQLQTSASRFRLNQIEKIRANGVGDLVALPQLVVCGDQSAGKSSVLEGITGIPFPRQEGLCTRFPTEIILRNSTTSETTVITATIRPHAARPSNEQKKLLAYRKIVPDMSELPVITQQVSRLMNIRGYTDNNDGVSFASDALRIEITGPTGLHLSVVDLPGLISVANEEQTEQDINAIYDMVNGYLQSSRTIILPVVQASNDMANQGIIKLAQKHDPDGQRTVGIITKPDLINEGTESRIALVAKNEDTIKLKLGFYLLKNPSPTERAEGMTMESRSRRELQFFSSPAWKSQGLDPERVGTDKLRLALQDLLDAHIERELPKVRDEIESTLAATEARLKALGDARPTVAHIRTFLTGLSMEFHQLLRAALDGHYQGVDSDFFSQHDFSRLRARVQESNTTFSTYMREQGRTRKLGTPKADAKPSKGINQRIVNKTEMMQWVKQAYSRTRGRELPGNNNSALLSELFLEQSQRWEDIARNHIQDIVAIVLQWNDQALLKLVPEQVLRMAIDEILRDWLDKAEKLATTELENLMSDERRGPMTYNHYYTDNVQRERLQAHKSAIQVATALIFSNDNSDVSKDKLSKTQLNKFTSAIESQITVNMDEKACSEALIQLDAYYKVARKTFVDNVARQAVERHIVGPLSGAFNPSSISSLSDEELLKIGSESKRQAAQRSKLSSEAEGLRKGLLDLQRAP